MKERFFAECGLCTERWEEPVKRSDGVFFSQVKKGKDTWRIRTTVCTPCTKENKQAVKEMFGGETI